METCDGHGGASTRWPLRIAAAYSASSTTLLLAGDRASLSHRALTATLDAQPSRELTLTVGAGASLGGAVGLGARRFSLGPGFLALAGVGYRLVDGSGRKPFVLVGGTLAASAAPSREDTGAQAEAAFGSIDLRASITVGKFFAGAIGPYATARAFGGPVLWKLDGASVAGTDAYHVQLGAGVVAAVRGFDALLEIVPLGERAVTVGAGYRF